MRRKRKLDQCKPIVSSTLPKLAHKCRTRNLDVMSGEIYHQALRTGIGRERRETAYAMSDWDWAANFALSKLDLRILFLLKTKSFFFFFFLFYSSCARPVWPPKLVCKLETTFGAAQPPRPPPPDRRHKLFKLRQCRRRPRCRRRRKLPRQSLDAPLASNTV